MRIFDAPRPPSQHAARALRGAGAPAFAPEKAPSTSLAVAGPRSASATLVVAPLDIPDERRRRALRHGRKLLDALDALNLAALGGGDASRAASNLAGEAREQVDAGEPDLAALIAQIRIRAEVELAKAEVAKLNRR